MKTLLFEVQDTVQKYANIMARVSGIDVEVADSDLCRVAGTGIFADRINQDMSNEGYVYRHVMNTGQTQLIEEPGKHELCENCRLRDNCHEAVAISKPIFLEKICIGVIGLVGSLAVQKAKVLKNKKMYMELLDQIAEFIAAKVRDYHETSKKIALINTLDSAINHINQGVLIIGEDRIVTAANKAAQKQFNNFNPEGLNVSLEATGDQLNNGNEYRIRVQGKEMMVFGKEHKIPNPSSRYAKMLIFSDSKEFQKQSGQNALVATHPGMDAIIGKSESTSSLKKEIEKIAKSSSTVLITGESGTGKEVAAIAIWKMSDRKDKEFVAINCAAIPESLLEAELFGYVKGAFTGAAPGGRQGKFEVADQGVLFLDEIGDMPLYMQVKLLRVLQERKIVRVGSNQLIPVDVRVIAATNRDLKEMIAEKKFREDLYYRLNVIPLKLVPLRKRLEDIEDLAYYFARHYAGRFNKKFCHITAGAVSDLQAYSWYGNVRELENTMEFMINMMDEDGILSSAMLPSEFLAKEEKKAQANSAQTLEELEKAAIQAALERFGTTLDGKKEAAKHLGMSLATLYRKIKPAAGH
ncbi:MAG: sigma 54-interacting transcriptional regulator [Spirochaetes bacterium]|nr:sigma 54-interacting transcriptional regulator [Spirochaetota bacterium]